MNENEENKKAEISEISGKTRKDRGKKDFLNFRFVQSSND
jgi:hypothetical protein